MEIALIALGSTAWIGMTLVLLASCGAARRGDELEFEFAPAGSRRKTCPAGRVRVPARRGDFARRPCVRRPLAPAQRVAGRGELRRGDTPSRTSRGRSPLGASHTVARAGACVRNRHG